MRRALSAMPAIPTRPEARRRRVVGSGTGVNSPDRVMVKSGVEEATVPPPASVKLRGNAGLMGFPTTISEKVNGRPVPILKRIWCTAVPPAVVVWKKTSKERPSSGGGITA